MLSVLLQGQRILHHGQEALHPVYAAPHVLRSCAPLLVALDPGTLRCSATCSLAGIPSSAGTRALSSRWWQHGTLRTPSAGTSDHIVVVL